MKKQYQFKTYEDKIIYIDFIESIDNIDVSTFLNTYKISNFLFGKFFVKRLFNKLFKYHLNQKMNWDIFFWKNINIDLIETKVTLDSDLYKIRDNYEKFTDKKRLKDIRKYQLLLNEKYDLGAPLFISGACINFLGGNVNDNDIFMLDGSRRLYAHILNESNPNVLFIDLKIELNEQKS